MIAFEVSDMSCGHCVGAITQALKAADPQAQVQVDLASRSVRIEAPQLGEPQLAEAIRAAGYTPIAVARPVAPPAARSAGGCCGCR